MKKIKIHRIQCGGHNKDRLEKNRIYKTEDIICDVIEVTKSLK